MTPTPREALIEALRKWVKRTGGVVTFDVVDALDAYLDSRGFKPGCYLTTVEQGVAVPDAALAHRVDPNDIRAPAPVGGTEEDEPLLARLVRAVTDECSDSQYEDRALKSEWEGSLRLAVDCVRDNIVTEIEHILRLRSRSTGDEKPLGYVVVRSLVESPQFKWVPGEGAFTTGDALGRALERCAELNQQPTAQVGFAAQPVTHDVCALVPIDSHPAVPEESKP